jgi:phosphoglycolate phosphatase
MNITKQIFLDLDGPLLDGKERHYYCYRSILNRFGFNPICIDEYWEKKRALVNRRELLNLSGAEVIYDDFLAAWLLMIESPDALALDKVQEGAVDCLRSWKEKGIELTLVTMRKDKQALEEQLKLTGLRQFLDAVLVCDHAKGGEGKADAVRVAFHSKKLTENAVWIGDTEADWKAAKSLGSGIVLLSNGLRDGDYLEALSGALVMPSIVSLKSNVLKMLDVN